MTEKMKKTAQVSSQCVACGCCAKVCPLGAISIPRGILAQVDAARCVGCGKCAAACPASVISIHTAPNAAAPNSVKREVI